MSVVRAVKNHKDVDIKVVRVRPDMAKLWLNHNDVNRRLDMKRVRKFARDMESGRWILNPGDVICFAPDGSLLNGQHRLNAVVLAKIPVEFYVATNVDPAAQVIMDKGKPRRVSDNLHMFHGVPRKYASKITAIARYILTYEMGFWDSPNEADALDIWQRYQDDLIWLYEGADELPWNRGSYYAAPLLFAHKQEPERIEDFHHGLAQCSPYADRTPQAVLFRNLSSPKLRTGGMKGLQMSFRIFNAIIAYLEHKSVRSLYLSTVGYDKLKKRWGMVSKRLDGSCAWTNCPCDPYDNSGLCWVHKNYGVVNKRGKKSKGD